jgi:hypothetical protein
MPVIIGGSKEQQKKYLGRLIEEPLVAVCFSLLLILSVFMYFALI